MVPSWQRGISRKKSNDFDDIKTMSIEKQMGKYSF